MSVLTSRARAAWPRPIRALVWRDYAITRSYRFALTGDLFFGVLNLAVFYFIARTFRHARIVNLSGAPSYFAFAAVGLAITVVLQSASIGLARRIREEQLSGTLEVLLAHPLSSAQLSLGLAGFPFLFAILRAGLYLAVASPWLDLGRVRTDWLGVAIAFAAVAAAVTAIGIALGAMVLVFKRSEVLGSVVAFALGALGGAYFPVRVLPAPLRDLTVLVPTRAGFEAVRHALFLGGSWAVPTLELVGFAAIGLPVAIRIFGAAIEHNRRAGTLSQY